MLPKGFSHRPANQTPSEFPSLSTVCPEGRLSPLAPGEALPLSGKEPRSPEAPGDSFSSQNKEQKKPGAQGIRTQQMRQGTEKGLVNAGSGKIRKCHDMR